MTTPMLNVLTIVYLGSPSDSTNVQPERNVNLIQVTLCFLWVPVTQRVQRKLVNVTECIVLKLWYVFLFGTWYLIANSASLTVITTTPAIPCRFMTSSDYVICFIVLIEGPCQYTMWVLRGCESCIHEEVRHLRQPARATPLEQITCGY